MNHCNDKKQQWSGRVLANDALGGAAYLLRVSGAREIVPCVRPGQFAMLRLADGNDPLLGRPLGIYRAEDDELTFLYRAVGKMTNRLARLAVGTEIVGWGPLGNGWNVGDLDSFSHIVCVAGGVGQVPFLTLAAEVAARRKRGDRAPEMTLLFGGANEERLVGADDFRTLGITVHTATDDGSCGHHGRVTDLLDANITGKMKPKVLACGPHAMLKAAAAWALNANVACDVSLETPMACGLGLCFGCVVEYRDANGEWDYRRTCIDGPMFDATRLRWEGPVVPVRHSRTLQLEPAR
ncbi:MAG: dihydroorotate dehydrogenase electron transfer subunit [Thermoguttaceae bacterium]